MMEIIERANLEKERAVDELGDVAMGAILELERRLRAQEAVASAVEGRGYREGWTAVQFLARQVAKLQEELGELSEAVTVPARVGPHRGVVLQPYWLDMIGVAALCAQVEFDGGGTDAWELAQVEDLEAVKGELADLQVVLFCAAAAVGELGGEEFDVVEAALRKAMGDVERGVR